VARFARVVIPDLPHHVTQRGNRRERIFFPARTMQRGAQPPGGRDGGPTARRAGLGQGVGG
jgi:hypothetical protein